MLLKRGGAAGRGCGPRPVRSGFVVVSEETCRLAFTETQSFHYMRQRERLSLLLRDDVMCVAVEPAAASTYIEECWLSTYFWSCGSMRIRFVLQTSNDKGKDEGVKSKVF